MTQLRPGPIARDLGRQARDNPAQAGVACLAVGLILQMSFIVKIVSYAILTLGLVFLWEAFKQQDDTSTS